MARGRNRPKPVIAAGEIVMWMLFAVLLFPAGVVGWAIGRDTSHHGRTVTVTVSAPATAAPAPATTTTAPAPTTATTAKPAPKPGPVASAATVAAGKAVFLSAGCAACHTFTPAGTKGTVGPDLDTTPEVDAKATNTPLAAFVKESIVSPNAYIAPGYPKSIMPENFASTLGAKKVDDLVAFLTAGKS